MPAAFPVAGDVLTAAEYNKLPRGIMGVATLTSNTAAISSVTDVGLSLTFTAVTGRQYVAKWYLPECQQATTAGTTQVYITDSGNTVLSRTVFDVLSTTAAYFMAGSYAFTGSGSTTLKLRILTSAGTVTVKGAASDINLFTIEDVGAS